MHTIESHKTITHHYHNNITIKTLITEHKTSTTHHHQTNNYSNSKQKDQNYKRK